MAMLNNQMVPLIPMGYYVDVADHRQVGDLASHCMAMAQNEINPMGYYHFPH